MGKQKRCKVKDRVQHGRMICEKSQPISDEQVYNLNMLISRLSTFQPTVRLDKWTCGLSNDGIYHVNVLRSKLDYYQRINDEVIIP